MQTKQKPTYEELEKENSQLKKRVVELETEVVSLRQQVADLQAQVDKLTKMLFGKKSERSKKANAKTPQIDNSKSKRDTNGGGGRQRKGVASRMSSTSMNREALPRLRVENSLFTG